jgi:poly-gamma-glutamate synthesis protein (capsule biosynthesis protein)
MPMIANASDALHDRRSDPAESITLFLCGDVMLGRGVDQILPHPGDPRIHEPQASSAMTYVELAEKAYGPIPRPVDFSYVWGDALAALQQARPHVRIVNLETSITRSADYLPKGINYKMSPDNVACLSAAKVDCCAVANNHVLDWGRPGLVETLETLEHAGIRTVGAGRNAAAAEAPAVLEIVGGTRVLVFAFGSTTSGIPEDWAAGDNRPGVNLLDELSAGAIARVARQAQALRRPGDILVASIHWGENWGYKIPDEQRTFAHGLIDMAGFDIVHGHSSHHAKAIELYQQKPILYGCGDFLNDYEGIVGYEAYRDDLAIMYLPKIAASDGRLLGLTLIPFLIRRFRLSRAAREDAAWLQRTLERESAGFGVRVALNEDLSLTVSPR